ncbi:GNAT family N-acetyltransferase [Leptolyngbya sp. FACHB-36]|uniref:GNAT family N-acetyltransferase n=1 Tax=Leptolyngbya sp. FACHB-36 TaxID=2692808 RepID=UPI0016803E2A|nr:GNAT family protein [Leptolyngbya sp. FACHB-36]MBD2022503.1 GNAT family N-acetyltransferase [Leptolyngbya sp. FACHB-36]
MLFLNKSLPMEPPQLTKPFPVLETDRLHLRQLEPSDVQDVYEICSNAEVTQYYDCDPYTVVEQAERFIARMQQRFASGEGMRWAVTLRSTHQVIGTCGYNNLILRGARGIIGYELKRTHWGHGYMREALQPMLAYGFGVLNLNRIEAFVMLDNQRSSHLLSRLGFVEEGILREYGFWKHCFWDLRCFSLLKRDWHSSL